MVVDRLTENGAIDPKLLYEAPFMDIAPTGPEQVFDLPRVDRLLARIEEFNGSEVA